MEFGMVPIDEAEGAILAHSFRLSSGRILKGHVVTAHDIIQFHDAGIEMVMAARLGSDDVAEDLAARRLADAVAGAGMALEQAVGGRINLMARCYGVLTYQRDQLDALNGVDESLTVATLPPFAMVEPGQMIGTVKVIPFAVPGAVLHAAEECAGRLCFDIKASQPRGVGLIQTHLPGLPGKVLTKSSSVTRHRVEGLGGRLVRENRCAHDIQALSEVITDQINEGIEIILVIGASAVTDRRDVIPAAIERASGRVEHFGLPVDPGNLLLLGRVGDVPVIGVPGCARSPKLNGFDWVLQRLLCGLALTENDLAAMGSGGLLNEIAGRPMPRAAAARANPSQDFRVYSLVLAAGDDPGMWHSSDGVPNVARVVRAAMESIGNGVYVVTGAHEENVSAALGDYTVSFTYNPNFDEGLATSLRRGLSALPADADGVVVCLANDPAPSTMVIDALIDAFEPQQGRGLCVPMRHGLRGTPLLIARRYFAELHEHEGDTGARYLTGAYPSDVIEVTVDSLAGSKVSMPSVTEVQAL